MKQDEVSFKIDMLPVSENKAIRTTTKGGYKTKEYKEWEEFVLLTVKEKTIAVSKWYEVEIIFHYPLHFKNKKIRRRDAHNMIKYAIDTILHNKVVDQKGEKIDDSRIVGGTWYKCDSKDEYLEISFYAVGKCS
jgi:Holliday junction resolvase RusA-like endonuclease